MGAVRAEGGRRGFAMVAVLLVLLALFVLCAPFLLTVRNADQASSEQVDRAEARVALDSAVRHARARLGGSHPATDKTPYSDSLDEVRVTNEFPKGFLDPDDPDGVMWDVDATDVTGEIDLNSAPPQVIGNLTGGLARLSRRIEPDAKSLPLQSTGGFGPQGLVWLSGELISYGAIEGGELTRLARELNVARDGDGNAYPCGPQPKARQDLGELVMDEHAMAVARWRTRLADPKKDLRRYDGIDQVEAASGELLALMKVPDAGVWDGRRVLERTTTVFAGVRGGAAWQHPARIVVKVDGGPEKGCRLVLDHMRWFNPGTTVRVSDGRTSELGIVRKADDGGVILMDPLRNDYEPYAAVVWPLARRPVNVNTAPPEVLRALFLNLQLRGRDSYMTSGKTDELVDVIVASRPFDGFRDFVERVVLPSAGLEQLPKDAPVVPRELAPDTSAALDGGAAAGGGFLTDSDAAAIYKNALNANDGELLFSTMPLCFDSHDVYRLDARTSVNAASGVQRVALAREQTELVVPQRPLMQVWARQEDFDLALRLDREAPGWLSGPEPTARFDPLYGSDPPTRSRANLGQYDTMASPDPLSNTATYTFASREQDGWAQLAPSRTDETDSMVALRAGHVLHFDDERRDAEGRYLPDGTVSLSPGDKLVGWTNAGGLLDPLSFSCWVKPRALEDGARLLDLGGQFPDTDRVSLLFENGDLVLRVIGGGGDHPESAFHEWGEARYPLAGNGPGMPLDTWVHVQADVRGDRPDQISLLVDGRPASGTPGLTRLSGGITSSSATIPVDSTAGFPDDPCVLRIGDELVEARKSGPRSFDASFSAQGTFAGFGGRQARERFLGPDPGVSEATLNTTKDLDHPPGTSVELYGYSMTLADNLSPAAGSLTDALGPFAVGIVRGIYEKGEKTGVQMEPIVVSLGLSLVTIGYGMDSRGNDVEGLVVEPADTGMDLSSAFNKSGGYALILAYPVGNVSSTTGTAAQDVDGSRIGYMELLHYTAWDGRILRFDRRGDAVPELKRPPQASKQVQATLTGRSSLVFDWDPNTTIGGLQPNTRMEMVTKIIPISIGVRGPVGGLGFPVPGPKESAFVQITPRQGSGAESTEWVRYDEIAGDQFVRSDPTALTDAWISSLGGQKGAPVQVPGPRPGGGGVGPPGKTTLVAPPPPRLGPASVPSSPAVAPPAPQAGGPYWQPDIGVPEDKAYVVSRSLRSAFQFRGVMGTYPHAHTAGDSTVLPVWEVSDGGLPDQGWPGRFDRVFLMDADPSSLGFPGVVQHAHRPFQYTTYGWTPGDNLAVTENPAQAAQQDAFLTGRIWVALRDAAGGPVAAGAVNATADPYEQRTVGRVLSFPSGERPRLVDALSIGGDYRARGDVPSAVVDEVVFGTTTFGEVQGSPATRGAQLVLQLALNQGATSVDLLDNTVRGARLHADTKSKFLDGLAQDAGLVRIGREVLCYDSIDTGSYALTLPPGGRGLLGTEDSNHAQGEPVTFLNEVRVSVLAGSVGANDANIPLASTEGFPPQGTVLIDDELVHYTRVRGDSLEMPAASEVPGAMDGRGGGIFRGRYGTTASAHSSGTPVIVMPFRYWDRWTEHADAPELDYFDLSLTQPGAFWRSVFWEQESAVATGPRIGVLQRTDSSVPWDADPASTDGLDLLYEDKKLSDEVPIGVQADRVDWRVFVRYEPGSYDPVQGLAHGWKATPRLRFLGAQYLGPGMVLRRIER